MACIGESSILHTFVIIVIISTLCVLKTLMPIFYNLNCAGEDLYKLYAFVLKLTLHVFIVYVCSNKVEYIQICMNQNDREQPTRGDCTVRVQWFTSVTINLNNRCIQRKFR